MCLHTAFTCGYISAARASSPAAQDLPSYVGSNWFHSTVLRKKATDNLPSTRRYYLSSFQGIRPTMMAKQP